MSLRTDVCMYVGTVVDSRWRTTPTPHRAAASPPPPPRRRSDERLIASGRWLRRRRKPWGRGEPRPRTAASGNAPRTLRATAAGPSFRSPGGALEPWETGASPHRGRRTSYVADLIRG